MNAIFKCQDCGQLAQQSIEERGLMVNHCPTCRGVYLDCQNLDESLDYCNKLDILRGNKNEKASNN